MTILQSGNLKLSQDPHGFWILRYDGTAGLRSIRHIFPPYAQRIAIDALDRTVLFLRETNRNPQTRVLHQVMIGRQVTNREPSPKSRAKQRKTRRKKR